VLFSFSPPPLVEATACDNPIFELIQKEVWAFDYLTNSKLSVVTVVCPDINGQDSCCDILVLDSMKNKWNTIIAAIRAIKTIDFAILQDVVTAYDNALDQAIADLSNEGLTQSEINAFTTFFQALQSAANNLVPGVENGFQNCYSYVLEYYAAVLCHSCEVVWDDWIIVFANGTIELNFAPGVCTDLQNSCGPLFQTFGQFEVAILAATANLAEALNLTRFANILESLEKFEAICADNADCLLFLCRAYLRAFIRYEVWSVFGGGNNGKRDLLPAINSGSPSLDKLITQANSLTSAVTRIHSHIAPRDSSSGSNGYTGTYDVKSTSTTLDTDPSGSPASTLRPFWLSWF